MARETTASPEKKRFHIVARLVCLFFALIIWLYVMEVDNPDYETELVGVPVTLTGVSTLENENGLSVFGGYDAGIDLVVKGPKSTARRYSADDIRITADVSGITRAGNHEIPLFFDLPAGLTMVESSVERLSLYIDERTSTVVDVKARLSSVTIPESYELGDMVTDTETVTVSGPKRVLDDIDYAQVSLDAGNIESSVSMVGTLNLVNHTGDVISNPYVRLSKTEVRVNIPVYCYKELTLTANTKYGYYNENNCRITVEPATVIARGDPAILDDMDTLVVALLDEKTITGDSSLLVRVNAPDSITLDMESDTATVSVRHIGTKTKTFSVRNINVAVADGVRYELLTTVLSVTVRGDTAAVNALRAEDITVSADMTDDITGSMGLVYTAGTVSINEDSGTVYELGEYNIQVLIR